MYIPIIVLVLLAIGAFIFVSPYRKGVRMFFRVVYNLIAGAFTRLWAFLRGVAPAAGAATLTAGVFIGRILLILSLIVILFMIILYFTLGAGIMAAGVITGHWKAALFLLATLMLWGSLAMFPSIWIFRPLNITSRYIVRPVVIFLSAYLILCTTWWGFGQIAPDIHASIDRLAGNQAIEVVDNIDAVSAKTEGRTGKIGRIDEEKVFGYQTIKGVLSSAKLPKGKFVRLVTEHAGVKLDKASEGTVWVMLESVNGDFVGGPVWMVPPRKINWDWNKPEPAPVVAATPQIEPQQQGQLSAQQTQLVPLVQPGTYVMEVAFTNSTTRNSVVLKRMDQEKIEFIQIWADGHQIEYRGNRLGPAFVGRYHHIVNGEVDGGNFNINPQTMTGEVEGPKGYAPLRIII